MNSLDTLKGKTVLITGASVGIGFAIAHQLALEGCNLILLCGSKGHIEKTLGLKEEGKATGDISWVECDIGNQPQAVATIEQLRKEGHSVDILINNAGIALGAPHAFWEQSLSDIQTILAANIAGVVNVTHAVLTNFLIPANQGTVMNISSVSGLEVPTKEMGEVIYHSARAFIEGFSNALRNEMAGTDIRVLVLRPGFVRTHIPFQGVGHDAGRFRRVFEGLQALEVDDVAAAARWMLRQPARIGVKALEVAPTDHSGVSTFDRIWNQRHGKN